MMRSTGSATTGPSRAVAAPTRHTPCRPPTREERAMDARDDLPAQAWGTLRGYQDATRYLAPLDGRPDADHPLRAAPAVTRRSASRAPDADSVRTYLRHSCDLTLRGGAAAAVTYPLAACALAEHYLVRRGGGSGAAAAGAAPGAAAPGCRPALPARGPRGDRASGGSG